LDPERIRLLGDLPALPRARVRRASRWSAQTCIVWRRSG